jgi:hypothetical protein
MGMMPQATIIVPSHVLEECRTFFRKQGERGCEGTALLIGKPMNDHVLIRRALIPEQECLKSPFGIAVRLTKRAHRTLVDALGPDEYFYIRIHSHPEEAFHSQTDDENGVLTHVGAISIVVPNFGRDEITIDGCAIYELSTQGWQRLTRADSASRIELV